MLYRFQVYSKVNQLCVCGYSVVFEGSHRIGHD